MPTSEHPSTRRARPAMKSAAALVECTVRVSPTLSRLFRKCEAAEAQGASALDALLSPGGIRSGEVEQLRNQIKELRDELGAAHNSGARLRQDVVAATTALAQCAQERIELEQRLEAAKALEEKGRQEIADAETRLADLGEMVTRLEATLRQSIFVEDLDESARCAIRTFKTRLSLGDEVRAAALVAVGYDPLRVNAAMALRDLDEMGALERLLARATWRRRVVLWLLRTKSTPQ